MEKTAEVVVIRVIDDGATIDPLLKFGRIATGLMPRSRS